MNIHRFRKLQQATGQCYIDGCTNPYLYETPRQNWRICVEHMEDVIDRARRDGNTIDIEASQARIAVERSPTGRPPCPFCSSVSLAMVRTFSDETAASFWVRCMDCGATGPCADSSEVACDLWDERVTPSKPTQPGLF